MRTYFRSNRTLTILAFYIAQLCLSESVLAFSGCEAVAPIQRQKDAFKATCGEEYSPEAAARYYKKKYNLDLDSIDEILSEAAMISLADDRTKQLQEQRDQITKSIANASDCNRAKLFQTTSDTIVDSALDQAIALEEARKQNPSKSVEIEKAYDEMFSQYALMSPVFALAKDDVKKTLQSLASKHGEKILGLSNQIMSSEAESSIETNSAFTELKSIKAQIQVDTASTVNKLVETSLQNQLKEVEKKKKWMTELSRKLAKGEASDEEREKFITEYLTQNPNAAYDLINGLKYDQTEKKVKFNPSESSVLQQGLCLVQNEALESEAYKELNGHLKSAGIIAAGAAISFATGGAAAAVVGPIMYAKLAANVGMIGIGLLSAGKNISEAMKLCPSLESKINESNLDLLTASITQQCSTSGSSISNLRDVSSELNACQSEASSNIAWAAVDGATTSLGLAGLATSLKGLKVASTFVKVAKVSGYFVDIANIGSNAHEAISVCSNPNASSEDCRQAILSLSIAGLGGARSVAGDLHERSQTKVRKPNIDLPPPKSDVQDLHLKTDIESPHVPKSDVQAPIQKISLTEMRTAYIDEGFLVRIKKWVRPNQIKSFVKTVLNPTQFRKAGKKLLVVALENPILKTMNDKIFESNKDIATFITNRQKELFLSEVFADPFLVKNLINDPNDKSIPLVYSDFKSLGFVFKDLPEVKKRLISIQEKVAVKFKSEVENLEITDPKSGQKTRIKTLFDGRDGIDGNPKTWLLMGFGSNLDTANKAVRDTREEAGRGIQIYTDYTSPISATRPGEQMKRAENLRLEITKKLSGIPGLLSGDEFLTLSEGANEIFRKVKVTTGDEAGYFRQIKEALQRKYTDGTTSPQVAKLLSSDDNIRLLKDYFAITDKFSPQVLSEPETRVSGDEAVGVGLNSADFTGLGAQNAYATQQGMAKAAHKLGGQKGLEAAINPKSAEAYLITTLDAVREEERIVTKRFEESKEQYRTATTAAALKAHPQSKLVRIGLSGDDSTATVPITPEYIHASLMNCTGALSSPCKIRQGYIHPRFTSGEILTADHLTFFRGMSEKIEKALRKTIDVPSLQNLRNKIMIGVEVKATDPKTSKATIHIASSEKLTPDEQDLLRSVADEVGNEFTTYYTGDPDKKAPQIDGVEFHNN